MDEAALLRLGGARRRMADCYEGENAGRFQAFVDAYGDGNDERLVAKLIEAFALLTSLKDPENWIAKSRRARRKADELPFEQTQLGQDLLADVKQRIEALDKTFNAS